jgi:hypothetical protein
MSTRGRERWAALAVAVLAFPLGTGCPSVTRDEREIVTNREWTLDPLAVMAVDVDLTGFGTGTLDATVQWTSASNDVDLFVTAQSCTPEMFGAERCAYMARADSATAKPERVSFRVSAGDRYRFWVVNFGPQRESGTIEVGLEQDS